MSTHAMQPVKELSRGDTKVHAAEVPGFGEVLVVQSPEGHLALILPDQAVKTEQDLSAIRRDLGEVRDRLRALAPAAKGKGART